MSSGFTLHFDAHTTFSKHVRRAGVYTSTTSNVPKLPWKFRQQEGSDVSMKLQGML